MKIYNGSAIPEDLLRAVAKGEIGKTNGAEVAKMRDDRIKKGHNAPVKGTSAEVEKSLNTFPTGKSK